MLHPSSSVVGIHVILLPTQQSKVMLRYWNPRVLTSLAVCPSRGQGEGESNDGGGNSRTTGNPDRASDALLCYRDRIALQLRATCPRRVEGQATNTPSHAKVPIDIQYRDIDCRRIARRRSLKRMRCQLESGASRGPYLGL